MLRQSARADVAFLPSKSVRSVYVDQPNRTHGTEQTVGIGYPRDAHLADDGIVSRVRIAS
jgi:hypothetical protein